MTNILALDLGTTTGWAVASNIGHASIIHGTQHFKPSRYEGGGMRYLRFQKWLTELYSLRQFNMIYFEEVRRHMSTDAAHVYGGFLATLSAWCEERGIPYSGVPVQTIKKSATGKGNADKKAMIAAVRERGHNPADDNEADAIALLYHQLAT